MGLFLSEDEAIRAQFPPPRYKAVDTPTVRVHPRTLAQAFPQDHADPIEHYRSPWYSRIRDVLAAVGCGLLIGAVFVIKWSIT